MQSVHDWFFDWIEYHQLLHPHRSWVRPHDPTAMDFYAGWIDALGRRGATLERCQQASRKLQETPPKFLNEQLPAVLSAIDEIHKTESPTALAIANLPDPGLVQASIASARCPECEGSGWARRRAWWPALRWAPMLDLFCRCPAGRWRRHHDGLGNHDDLQALPDLWDADLASPLWTGYPADYDERVEDREWRYLPPGEEPPRGGNRPALSGIGGPAR